ncbi:MAG: IclR family transcriptional regulator [Hyphomicrobiales bacterium]
MSSTRTRAKTKARRPFGGVAAVNHAITLLKALPSNGGSLGVNELSRRVGLHKSTVSRLLSTLGQHEFIERNGGNGQINLGIGLIALVSPLLGKLDVVKAAKPILDMVARETGETASLALWSGHEAVMVEQTLGSRAVVHYAWPGKCVPAHTTAAGKAFLAHLPAAVLDKVLASGLKRHTPFSIVEPAALLCELDDVRRCGFAGNDQENELESCGIASIVRNFRGEPAAALTVAVPKHRFDAQQRDAIIVAVLRAADQLSRRLGYEPKAADTQAESARETPSSGRHAAE